MIEFFMGVIVGMVTIGSIIYSSIRYREWLNNRKVCKECGQYI